MMELQEYFNNLSKGKKNELSLNAMRYFMDVYGNFERQMKFIHIAGTNGKGSCTEIISNILQKQGYKVGKFISPHLIRYNERISINGKEISDEEMWKIIEELKPEIEKYNKESKSNVTFFEVITIIAMLYFYRNKVDFVVLETGLGGKNDCTNIISKPIVSVITSIGYDHMHILGDTLPKIALQKAGIIKENSNTVIFEQEDNEVNNVFINKCKELDNNLNIVKNTDISNYRYDSKYQYFDYKNLKDLKINLKGKIQIRNACLCIETIEIMNKLGYKVDKQSIMLGLETVVHKARMEEINDTPKIIYDGAHNELAIKELQNKIQMYYKDFKRVYIISILKRKDYKKMLELLSKDDNATFVVTSGIDENRYVSSDELYSIFKQYVKEDKIQKNRLNTAIEDAMLNMDKSTISFVIGSFYPYGFVIEKIKEIKNRR